MNRIEFMAQLERLLSDLPDSERKDAVAYYENYFDEAGPEQEAEVIQKLGSPGKVAATIRSSYRGEIPEGEYTEQGYRNPEFEQREQMIPRTKTVARKRGGGWWALIIVGLVFVSPLLLGLVGGIVGILFGIGGGIIGLIFGAFGSAVGFLIGGIAGILKGVVLLFHTPASGMVALGSGLLMMAVSILLLTFGWWFTFRIVPSVIRWFVNVVSRIFHRGRGGERQ